MLTPFDKLVTRKNDIIQIVVTRSCDIFTCSNCTQLLPFRRDALHMSVDCFRDAVRSLADWPGVVGIFGGNPCSHPRFATLMEILEEQIQDQAQRGLWSNNLLSHGELVRRVFYPHGRFNLNAHADKDAAREIERWLPGRLIPRTDQQPAWHAAILVDRADLNVSDEQWIQARERCDINQKWSAAIVERDGKPFAYFCEVAAALDGVRNENHGVPARAGWWRQSMASYAHQVRACCDRGCGVPLRVRGALDSAATYNVSSSWSHLAKWQGAKSRVTVSDVGDERATDAVDYMRKWTP